MEEEKKKKKQKKKKNKQNKATGASAGVGESASSDVNGIEQDNQSQVSDNCDVVQKDVVKMAVESDQHANGNQGASLEGKIEELQKEKGAYIQREVVLEMKILQLQSEKESWIQKEVSLEEKIKQMAKERISWIQKENATNETTASLNSDNTRLRAQVMELEVLRNNLLQENQQLMESISGLQSRILNLERETASAHLSTESTMQASENGELNSQLKDTRALVEKLLSENSELIEKVNELYVELDQRGATVELSDPMVGKDESARVTESPVIGNPITGVIDEKPASNLVPDHVLKSIERTSVSGETMGSLEYVAITSDTDDHYVSGKDTTVIPNSPETIKSEEIVQIPLDENEVEDAELENEENVDVPISDAPLIGAPLRLISFFARYVSGADLVNK